ncbi:MAG: choice-of-anchor Q domain-containing protein, partial [Patescibacteria group bacterium]
MLGSFFVLGAGRASAVYPVAGRRKFLLTGLLCSFFIFLGGLTFASPAYGATYYVDSSVTDTNVASATPDFTTYNHTTFATDTGTDSVFKTIADINAFSALQPGDNVYFRKGQIWREQLTVPASGTDGHVIIFGAFGSGDDPILLGSQNVLGIPGDWTDVGSSVWTRSLTPEPLFVMFNGTIGSLDWTLGTNDTTPDAQYEWSWSGNVLSVYSEENPTSYYSAIEAPKMENILYGNNTDYITVQDINFYFPNYDAVYFTLATGIRANRIEAYYFYGGSTANGITNHNNGSSLDVYDSIFLYGAGPAIGIGGTSNVTSSVFNSEMGYASQGFGVGTTGGTYNIADCFIHDTSGIAINGGTGSITINDSIIKNTDNYSFYLTTGSAELYNNIFYNGMYLYVNGAGNLTTKNNITYDPNGRSLRLSDTATYAGDYNLFWRDDNNTLFTVGSTSYNRNDFSSFKSAVSQDTNSFVSNPSFTNASGSYSAVTDFQLAYNSPNIDSGTDVSLTADYAGNPIYGTPDIGAYEYQPPYTVGTTPVPTTGSMRIYSNGKYRALTASTTAETIATSNFSVVPAGGGYYTASTSAYMDISITEWSTTGAKNKSWIATSSATAVG